MKAIKIVHLYPDLLNLYGDGGNVLCLQRRCEWRGLPVEIQRIHHDDAVDLSDADMVFLGGGPDREQKIATEKMRQNTVCLHEFIESDGVLLAICGGYQILGKECVLGDESVEGLSLIDIVTRQGSDDPQRLVSDIVIRSSLFEPLVVGYENHAGRTFLGDGLSPFGTVVSSVGWGNNDQDKADGVLYKNVIGTYLHGPLLGKNPHVADYLLEKIAAQRQAKGEESFSLSPLDDSVEHAAHAYVLNRLDL